MSIDDVPPLVHVRHHDRDAVFRAHRRGDLVRVVRGSYVPTPPPERPTWQIARDERLAQARALNDHFGPTVAISHGTAALIHGLWSPISEPVHVTHEFHSHTAPSAARPHVRHCRPLPAGDVVEVDGLRVTSVERTVLDCAATLSAPWAFAVADSAMRLITSPDRQRPEAPREAARSLRIAWARRVETTGPRRGRRQAREVIGRADPMSESPGESRMRAQLVAAGLPTPRTQCVVGAGGRTYVTDVAVPVPGHRWIHVEFDGAVKYAGASGVVALTEEKRREDVIRGLPETVGFVRVVEDDLRTERNGAFVDRVIALWPHDVPLRLTPVPALRPLPIRTTRRPTPG